MPNEATDPLRVRLVYDGLGPVHWDGGRDAFGVQDKDGVLHPGTPHPDGRVVFDLLFPLKPGAVDRPVLGGPFAHGPPAARFIYLGWRNTTGEFAQRFKVPLHDIGWDDIERARGARVALAGTVIDHHPRATSTGANVGGTRAVAWTPA